MPDPTPLVILVDTREQLPYSFDTSPRYLGTTVASAKLDTGDYSVPGGEHRIAVERKSMPDLVGCLTQGRARFERELQRAQALDIFAVVIEGTMTELAHGEYRSQLRPWAALQTLATWTIRYRTCFVWSGSRAAAECWTWSVLSKWWREQTDVGPSRLAMAAVDAAAGPAPHTGHGAAHARAKVEIGRAHV